MFHEIMLYTPKINRLRQDKKIPPKQPLTFFFVTDNLDFHDEDAQQMIEAGVKRKCRAEAAFFEPLSAAKHFDDSYHHVEHEYNGLFKERSPLHIFFK